MAKISVDGFNYNAIITEAEAYYFRAGKKVLLSPSTDSVDQITGGNGADYIQAGAGDDTISGGNGKDTIYADEGNDIIWGDSAKTLDSTEDNAKDLIYGGSGQDKIYGGNGADELYGDGKDITGWAGGTPIAVDLTRTAAATDADLKTFNDIIDGGNGPDRITGGLGGDVLTGGAGPDVFVYTSIADSRSTNGNDPGTSAADWDAGTGTDANGFLGGTGDYITDFTKGQDQLDFTALNAINTALHFSGTAPTTSGIWYKQDGGFTYVFADANGDGKADMAIKVNGLIAFSKSDFVGINDAPVLSDTSDPSPVLEAIDAHAQDLSAITGTFSVTDPDAGDILTPSVVGTPVVQLNGSPFALPGAAAALTAAGAFTLTGNTSNGGAVDIAYKYDPGAANLDFLRAGDSLTVTYTIKVNDGTVDSGTQTVTFTITGTNDAPVLDASKTPVGIAVLEDADAPSGAVGTLVSALADPITSAGSLHNVSDVDSGALTGIAVTAADSAHGSWFYSTDNGTTWTALPAVSESSALLLAPDARLYFQPAANYDGSADVTFRAWDQTSGTGGTTADTTANGGTTAFSTATDTATFDVTAVNDAPAGADHTVTTLEDTAYTFAAGDFGFSDPHDSPANALLAVKITTLPGAGALLLNGAAVSAGDFVSVTDINDGKLTFAPAADANGAGYASFSFQVQDDGGTANGGVDLDPTANTLTVDVTAVNDAPVLDASKTPVGIAVLEDAGAPSGAVGTLVSALVDPVTPVGGLDNVSDVDSGALTGIAVTAADSAHGSWWYSTNGGATWTALPSVNASSALLLAPDARLYFQPAANYDGSADITFRAWDQTSGTAGTTADTTTNGGTTAFSTATDTATFDVTPVNDAPVASGSATLTAINEDTATPPGATVTSLFSGNFSDAADAPSANTFAGIAISSYTADAAKGAWQYSTNGGGIWNTLGSASTTTALTLDASAMLRFVPAANYNGAATALSANLIESGQSITNGATIDLTGATGGSTHISSGTVALSETINAVNDAPAFSGLDNTPTFTQGGAAVVLDSNALVSDVELDAANNYSGATLTLARNGGANAQDVFGATGTLSLAGGNVVLSGATVGTYTNAGGTLAITFNASATSAAVDSVLQQLTYTNSGGTAPASVQINYTFNDGNAGAQGSGGALSATGHVTVGVLSGDTTPPTVASIAGASSRSGNVGTATFTVTFSESVTHVTTDDFQLFGTATAASPFPAITSVSGSGAVWTVTVSYDAHTVPGGGDRGNTLGLNLKSGTDVQDLAGNIATGSSFTTAQISSLNPAGTSGEPINLALTGPSADPNAVVTITVRGISADWTLNAGTHNSDGTWTVQTTDPGALTVMTPASYSGALVLDINMTWTNADGSLGNAYVASNVEAYAPGSPIFALSTDDNLTASSGADTLVFSQPIGNNVVYSFDVAHDRIDLIGFAGITGFASLVIANDASGNAVVSIGDGQTITLRGVDAASLSAANFEFDVDPVTTNTGVITIGDGAIMPFGGAVVNSGTIVLDSHVNDSALEVLFRGVTLTGGGQVLLSDSAYNVIFGGSADTVLNNLDNTISGAGLLGAGHLSIANAGTILADGTHTLVVDTGANVVANSGLMEATGSGGLRIDSALANTGHLWAHGGDIVAHGDVSGAGTATISGTAMLEFGGASDQHVIFDDGAAGLLRLDAATAFSGSVGGLSSDDRIDLGDVAFGGNSVVYQANDLGTGGTLSIGDGTHTAHIALDGQYVAAGLQADGHGGTLLAYDAPAADNTLLGGALGDILTGGAGNDILWGGAGDDTLTGGAGSDTFVFRSGDNSVDTITDFNGAAPGAGGDVLNIADLLSGFTSGAADSFIHLEAVGGNTVLSVDRDGAGTAHSFEQVAVLQGQTGFDLATLLTHGNIETHA